MREDHIMLSGTRPGLPDPYVAFQQIHIIRLLSLQRLSVAFLKSFSNCARSGFLSRPRRPYQVQ